jgi:hypothetical protein
MTSQAGLGATGLSPWCPFSCRLPLSARSPRMAARRRAGIRAFRNAGGVRRPLLGLPDDLVGEEGEAVTDGPGVEEAHGLLVAVLVEEALAGPERDRVDHQP